MRAAGELRLRLADLLGERTARGVLAATFHSVCARLLREHAELFGRTETYTIYDQGDLRRVIEALLADHRQREIQAAIARCGQPPASELERTLALAKSRLLTPERYLARSRNPAAAVVAAVWRAADAELERCNALGVRRPARASPCGCCASTPRGSRTCARRWRWLLVDEMQDTNPAQAALVHLLAGADGNVTVVGDADQAVYGFRSADPRNILAFGERYPRPSPGRAHAQLPLARRDRRPPRALHRAQPAAPRRSRSWPRADRADGSPRAASRSTATRPPGPPG